MSKINLRDLSSSSFQQWSDLKEAKTRSRIENLNNLVETLIQKPEQLTLDIAIYVSEEVSDINSQLQVWILNSDGDLKINKPSLPDFYSSFQDLKTKVSAVMMEHLPRLLKEAEAVGREMGHQQASEQLSSKLEETERIIEDLQGQTALNNATSWQLVSASYDQAQTEIGDARTQLKGVVAEVAKLNNQSKFLSWGALITALDLAWSGSLLKRILPFMADTPFIWAIPAGLVLFSWLISSKAEDLNRLLRSLEKQLSRSKGKEEVLERLFPALKLDSIKGRNTERSG